MKLTNRNTRWRCKICWRLTVKTTDSCHSHRSGVLTVDFKYISHLALVLLLFPLWTLNRKLRLGSKSQRFKKRFYSSFVVHKKLWFIVVRGELRTFDTSKMDLLATVYNLKSLTILTRSSILRSITGCWICLTYVFLDLHSV